MKWEIGKEYKLRNGDTVTLVAFHTDGRLILDKNGILVYRSSDGTFLNRGGRDPFYDLINPDEQTDEEREKIVKIFEVFNMNGSADAVRKGNSLGYTRNIAAKVLEILREGR